MKRGGEGRGGKGGGRGHVGKEEKEEEALDMCSYTWENIFQSRLIAKKCVCG